MRTTMLLVLSCAAVVTSGRADGPPQMIAAADLGFCQSPPHEDRDCDDILSELSEFGGLIDVLVQGLPRIKEARFGVFIDGDDTEFGWTQYGGFTVSVVDTLPSVQYAIIATAIDGCHKLSDGMHHLLCFSNAFVREETTFAVVPDPRIGRAQVTTCDDIVITIPEEYLGIVGIGGPPGYNPCEEGTVDVPDTPLQRSSWTTVKSLYR